MKWPGAELCIQAECEEEPLEPRAETLAVLGKCNCYKGGSSYQPVSTLSCLPLPPSASATAHIPSLPKSVWVLMPFTIAHHQPPANHHRYDVSFWVHFPPSLKTCFSSTPFKSLHCPSLLPDLSQHQMCPVHLLLSIPSSQLPKYLAALYLIPKEPRNSEHPAFSWVHSLLFSNTSPYFK